MVLPGLVYLYLRSSNFVWLLGALAAASVMGIDGSRTGLLFVALFLLSFLPLYWRATGWRAATLAKICLLGLVVISGLLIARPIAEQHITGKPLLGAVERVPELAFGRVVTIVENARKASPVAEDNSSVINAENADTVEATGQTTDKSRSETISNQASTAISQKSGRVSPEETLNRSGVQTAKDLIVQPDDNASGVTSVNEVATHNDQIRMRMITAGFEQIRSSPVWGGGIESSVVMTGGGPMVIHLSYLQVWGDYGLFGFLLFVIIMVLPLLILTKRVQALLTTRFSSIEQAGLLSALVVVLSYPLYGLLHPISNEFSEWAPMLMALAVIWNVTSKDAIGRATVDSSVRDHV